MVKRLAKLVFNYGLVRLVTGSQTLYAIECYPIGLISVLEAARFCRAEAERLGYAIQ